MVWRGESRSLSQTTSSPDALSPHPPAMHPQDVSRPKPSRGKSFLTRKASKKQHEANATVDMAYAAARPQSMDMHEKNPAAYPPFSPPAFSIVPDPLNELPTWYHKEVEAATASTIQFRVKYPLHNPAGPRWYRNHHLLPRTWDDRPPSVFSPSFPPMSSSPERGQDPSRMAGPSRTPSGSPLPTPSSSQIRIQEPVNPRSRKFSQTTRATVEIVDDSDPLALNGHHDYHHAARSRSDRSPEPESPTSPGAGRDMRSRRASLSNGARHKTVVPSPLSQSTSAVHLHSIDPSDIQLPRKLSKRRKPFSGIFAGQPGYPEQQRNPPGPFAMSANEPQNLRRQSALAPSMTSLPSLLSGKSKRGSVLGRLVKRFSVLRRPEPAATLPATLDSGWHHPHGEQTPRTRSPSAPQPPEPRPRLTSQSTKSSEPIHRVPAPAINEPPQDHHPGETSPTQLAYARSRSSSSSSITGLQMSGRLTIANPDEPSTGDNTPVQTHASLPAIHTQDYQADSRTQEQTWLLPDIARSDSPPPSEAVTPRRLSLRLTDKDVPAAPLSPPLPDLPPPTPASPHHDLPPEPPSKALEENGRPLSFSQDVAPGSPRTIPDLPSPVLGPQPPLPGVEDVLLSRASMWVNPPTPYVVPLQMPAEAPVDAQQNGRHAERTPSKKESGTQRSKSSSKSRQTETFMLVRSPSGNVRQPGEVFTANGEKWELVESPIQEVPPKPPKSKERVKSYDGDQAPPMRQESRRKERRASGEVDYDAPVRRTSTQGRQTSPSMGSMRSTQTPAPRDRRSNSTKRVSASPENLRASRPSSTYVAVGGALPERQPSTHRPTSQAISAADMSSMKAKESWEMERLWKARSIAYGPDGVPVTSPPTIGSESRPSTFMDTELRHVSSIPSVTALADGPTHGINGHGSSHTYVVVQTPYQSQQAGASPNTNSYTPHSPHAAPYAAHEYYKYPGYADRSPGPSPPRVSPRAPNPLPSPPRFSAYQPAPLPASLAGGAEPWQAGSSKTSTH